MTLNAKNKRIKILLVIASDLYVRNYIRSGIADKLGQQFDLSLLAKDTLELIDDVKKCPDFYGIFQSDDALEQAHYGYFNILMYHYRERSKTFSFRLTRETGLPLPEESNQWIKTIKQLLKKGRRGNKTRECVINGNRWRFPSYRKKFEQTLSINPSLLLKIQEAQPDIVLFPSSAYDPVGNDVARIAKEMKIPSVFLIDNWDNLSSKSIFWAPPKYLGVWSEQHVEHAKKIHKIPKEQVFPIGTPRFDHYFASRGQAGPSHFNFPYVLFSGCCLPFDETTVLKILDNELSEKPEIYGDLKIVYRPHPWRQTRKREIPFQEKNFKHIILDPQIKDQYLKNRDSMATSVAFQPDTSYYPPLIDNALFVTGPLTTFLIEALIFHKHFLGLAYDDGVHLTSPNNAYKYYEMYEGIEQHPGVTLAHKLEELIKGFRGAYIQSTQAKKTHDKWDDHLNYYLRIDDIPYQDRLSKMLTELASKQLNEESYSKRSN
jgi:hypothetical protein